ncbi:MAG TPA: hypothetical protein VHP83_25635 [Aggregatilineaceae bacterium]|nr:hypothetical protein [Aggregatilineaceae bacterium]
MVEAFAAYNADKALTVGIGAWCAYRDAPDLHLGGHMGEVRAECPVIIADQVDRGLSKGRASRHCWAAQASEGDRVTLK